MESLNLQGWMPIRIWQDEGEWRVDWCWFGERRLDKPFFRESVDEALRRPFNQAFRRQTALEGLSQWQAQSPGLAPGAFVYHASRSGLPLIGQALAGLASHVLISLPPPLDTLLRAELPREQQVAAIRGLLSAYGQIRNGQERALVIALDAWNIRERALMRECFPQVPWLYLYRDPLEIALSHLRQGGSEMVPGLLGSAWLDGDDGIGSREDEIARRLGLMLGAGLEHSRAEGNLLLNYSELPAAMGGLLADFFGLSREQALAAAVAGAQWPEEAVAAGEVPEQVRQRVASLARQPYEALEALRKASR